MNRKETEEALENLEAKYRLLTENMTEVVWTVDIKGNWTYISPSILKQTGFTVEEQMELRFKEVMAPESISKLKNIYAEETDHEEFIGLFSDIDTNRTRTVELQRYKKDGSLLWIESTLSFFLDAKGNPVIVGVDRDISERKKAQQALKESEE